ncbi:MAG: hypothetical protein L0Y71_06520 [Gemmataceae bacterium]|nr:hypothetical protein [Gemmataceae bacterium]
MRTTCGLAGLALLMVAGCGQRLEQEKDVTLEVGVLHPIALIDAPKYEQKIKVEFTSSESPINVYVVLGKDENAVMDELGKANPKLEIRGKAEKSKGETFEATIPAGKDYGVYLTGADKKTQVKLKIKSQ